MKIIEKDLSDLIPYARNPRLNDAAVDSVAASIKEFGWKQPIVIDKENVVIVGHTRLKAARKLGIKTVPRLLADDLSPEQAKAYRILDNKVIEKSEWDTDLLQLELDELAFDLSAFDVSFPSSVLDEELEEYELDRLSGLNVIVECKDEAETDALLDYFKLERPNRTIQAKILLDALK